MLNFKKRICFTSTRYSNMYILIVINSDYFSWQSAKLTIFSPQGFSEVLLLAKSFHDIGHSQAGYSI